VSVKDVTVTEGDRNTSNATITVTLSAAASTNVNVTLSTVDGTAKAGTDYSATTKTLTFAPGVISMTFTIPIIGDKTKESTETFQVKITSVTGATAGSNGTVTILDND
jgi:hypothetical protein